MQLLRAALLSVCAAAVLALWQAPRPAEATYSFSTTCEAPLKNGSEVTGKVSRPLIVYNNANKKPLLFYIEGWGQTFTMGLWCRTMGDDVDGALGTPMLVTNVTGIIDYRVATTKFDRKLVVVVLTKQGLRTRFSTDGGETWGSTLPVTHEFSLTDGVPQNSGSVARPAAFDLTFTGSEFTMAYYVRAPGEESTVFVEFMNGTSEWNSWGFDPAANTYDGVAVNVTAARGSGSALAAMKLRSDLLGNSDIAVASDNVYVLVAYQLGDNSVEFQTAPKSGVSRSLTKTGLGTVKNIGPRRQMKLVSAGKTGAFLLVSVVARYSQVGALLANDILAEVTLDGGKTWSQPRTIRLGAQQVTFDSVPQLSLGFTSEWLVMWNEDTEGVGEGSGSDILVSSSLNGQVWTSPEIFVNGNNTNVAHPCVYVTSGTSFVVAYDKNGAGLEAVSCPLNSANFGEALNTSGADAVSMGSLVAALFAVVMGVAF